MDTAYKLLMESFPYLLGVFVIVTFWVHKCKIVKGIAFILGMIIAYCLEEYMGNRNF